MQTGIYENAGHSFSVYSTLCRKGSFCEVEENWILRALPKLVFIFTWLVKLDLI